jgi:hypothetical protein
LRRKYVFAACAIVFLSSCRKTDRVKIETEEEAPRLVTMLAMSDKRAPSQLLEGWYSLEDNSWRWTASHFSVLLRPPAGAALDGAVLKLQLSIPQALLDRVKSTSLTATVNGKAFPPEKYSQAGSFTFAREIPAELLKDESVKVDFALDKFLAAGVAETRELGVIATAVGFESSSAPKQ